MNVEQEFERLFASNGWDDWGVFHGADQKYNIDFARLAQQDYAVYKKTVEGQESAVDYWQCFRVREFVNDNLVVCLTSTHLYIQTWAKLVAEELEEMAMWDTNRKLKGVNCEKSS